MTQRDIHLVVETGSLAGGVRVIGEIANRLSKSGHKVTIWSVSDKSSMKWFKLDPAIRWQSFLKTGTTLDYDQLTDVLSKASGAKIATFWRTAYAVQAASQPGEGYYLIQDYETSYAIHPSMCGVIEDTYKMGLTHLHTSQWAQKKIGGEYIGIGLSNFYSDVGRGNRQRGMLAVYRPMDLKGWSTLIEVSGYLYRRKVEQTFFGLNDRISLMWPVDYTSKPSDQDVRLLYSTSKVFLSTSRHEGFNLTALEAMACECPVVKTHDDGSDEYIEPGLNCLVDDDPLALADDVQRLIRDRQHAQLIASNGRKTALMYRWGDVMKRLDVLIKS